jgi:8-amino-7-oxononanoate synthase
MLSLNGFASGKLAALDSASLRRTLAVTAREDGPWVVRDGRRLLSLSCNDTLGLSRHPAVIEAAVDATRRWGAGAGASRLVTGNHPELVALEAALARHKGTEAACVFGSGYLANLGVIPALAGPDDLILADSLAHACLLSGAALSGARTLRFPHNDLDALRTLLAAHRAAHPRCLILTETVFSMDGDRAPLPALTRLAQTHDAWLLADDAHGLGLDIEGEAEVPLRIGTLSKAAGAYGGTLAASRPVIELMHSRARPFVYSTGLPPATAAAARTALAIIASDPELRARPLALARRFTSLTGRPEAQSHIVPILLGSAEAALAAAARLETHGILAAAIRPPTVPEGTARLRLSFSAGLTDADIDRLADLLPC